LETAAYVLGVQLILVEIQGRTMDILGKLLRNTKSILRRMNSHFQKVYNSGYEAN